MEVGSKPSIVSSFSVIITTLCFVINALNNKSIILLNLAEYCLILANSAIGLVAKRVFIIYQQGGRGWGL